MKTRRTVYLEDVVPPTIPLVSGSTIGMGLDIGTTEKKTSNPSALSVVEQIGGEFIARWVIRWKTSSPEVVTAIVDRAIAALGGRRARRLCIDATSERFFAAELRRKMSGRLPVTLVVASESLDYLGERMSYKQYLGNLLVNAIEDGRFTLPEAAWLRDDLRLVKRERGSFAADVAADGGHADAFDALKLALFALTGAGGGPASAMPVMVSSEHTEHEQWHNPYSSMYGRPPSHYA